ncbi:hypothetical protein [Janthinobacterium agaricidamnosum]|uniref:hypothetical protein n=1 Tax=Janthinobacterium agaricidamnosum TaxID=55508 RepID=UPI000B27E6C6|nr:hypothetical protein [Janthinobacterium agaricidamnosum]
MKDVTKQHAVTLMQSRSNCVKVFLSDGNQPALLVSAHFPHGAGVEGHVIGVQKYRYCKHGKYAWA